MKTAINSEKQMERKVSNSSLIKLMFTDDFSFFFRWFFNIAMYVELISLPNSIASIKNVDLGEWAFGSPTPIIE